MIEDYMFQSLVVPTLIENSIIKDNYLNHFMVLLLFNLNYSKYELPKTPVIKPICVDYFRWEYGDNNWLLTEENELYFGNYIY